MIRIAILNGLLVTSIMTTTGCDGLEEPKVALEYPVQLVEIPAIYRGHWSNSLSNCNIETGDAHEWLFVSAETVGSFEHMYPVSDVVAHHDRIEFTTQFGDKMAMKGVTDGRSEVLTGNGEYRPIVRCPEGSLE